MPEEKRATVSTSPPIKGAAEALDFCQKAFNAEVGMRMDAPDGTLMHGNMIIADTLVDISDEFPQWQAFTPDPKGYSSTLFGIATEGDVDAEFQQAVDAGAEVVDAVADRPWGFAFGRAAGSARLPLGDQQDERGGFPRGDPAPDAGDGRGMLEMRGESSRLRLTGSSGDRVGR